MDSIGGEVAGPGCPNETFQQDLSEDSDQQEMTKATDELMKTAKSKRAHAKGVVTRKVNVFRELQKREDIGKNVMTRAFDAVQAAFDKLELANEEYVVLNESTEEAIKEGSHYLCQSEQDLSDLLVDYESSLKLFGEHEKREEKSKISPRSTSQFRMEKMRHPRFSGNVREFPVFKSEYEKHMIPAFGEDAFVLKGCLEGAAMETIKGVEDDYSEMMKRLTDRYGDPRKLAEVILNDIKRLTPIADGDVKKFIRSIDVIEKAWLDIKRLKMESILENPLLVGQIEKLLPSIQKREWVLKAKGENYPINEMFQKLLAFLLDEKRMMEYCNADLRTSTSGSASAKAAFHVGFDEDHDESQAEQMVANLVRKAIEPVMSMVKQQQETLAGMTAANRSKSEVDRSSGGSNECWLHNNTTSHDIKECKVFESFSIQKRLNEVRRANACYYCLQRGHSGRFCRNKQPCHVKLPTGDSCNGYHHPLLHEEPFNQSRGAFHSGTSISNTGPAILMISQVTCRGQKLNVLWDPGANVSLITERAASHLGLQGKPSRISVTGIGNRTEWMKSKLFKFELLDIEGWKHPIEAYGLTEITADVGEVDTSVALRLFDGISDEDIRRPSGKVDLLIGVDMCEILPVLCQERGRLQLMRNQFGYCIRGSHPEIKSRGAASNAAKILIHHQVVAEASEVTTEPKDSLKIGLDNLLSDDALGIACQPRCGNCKCGKCPIGGNQYSIREERELSMIKKGLQYDDKQRKWIVEYPWIRDPHELPNNEKAVIVKAKATERRLMKMGSKYSEMYQDQFNDMIERGIARKISEDEMRGYDGSVHYITHHEVLKPESKSTPCRIVFNSSAAYQGHVINEYWAKGPKVLNGMFGILIRVRQRPVVLAGDIKKMFNAIGLCVKDQHTHRVVWRDLDLRKPFDHYVLTSVTFGDRPSGTIAALALQGSAERRKEEYPEVAEFISKNSYVDDLLQSVDSEEEAKALAANTERIIGEGGFKIKYWLIVKDQEFRDNQMERERNLSSNDIITNSNIMTSDQEKMLGMNWDTKSDVFRFKVKIFHPQRSETEFRAADVLQSVPEILTKRIILSQISGIYDPFGLVIPYTLRAKSLFRELCKPVSDDEGNEITLDWDDSIPLWIKTKWTRFFCEIFYIENLAFKRCIKPANAKNNHPTLVIFSDGSEEAYGTCAYVRWELDDGRYEARLIAAKNRIAPSKRRTIPQLELCGALIGARLRDTLTKEMDYQFERVFHLVDSSIVRAQIQKDSYAFDTYVGTKVAEIQSITNKDEWWWIPSKANAADLTTRPALPKNESITMTDEIWKNGPDFMRLPIEEWPISKLCDSTNQSDGTETKKLMNVNVNDSLTPDLAQLIDIGRFHDYYRMLGVSVRVLNVAQKKSFRGELLLSTSNIRDAEKMWIKLVQQEIPNDWEMRYRQLGPKIGDDGIIYVGERIEQWLKDNWNQDLFILLPASNPFTSLYITTLHYHDHGGIESTLAKLQSKFWVPGARKIIRKVKMSCVECRKLNHVSMEQKMGQLLDCRLQPSPPFYNAAVDLFGPFAIRDTVKRRSRGKAYGVIFNCLASRAVHLDVADSYDTNSFILVFRRFVSIRGYPSKMYSDKGTQIVSANKKLQEMTSEWDHVRLADLGRDQGMKWITNRSADAPWENGCSEALIKLVKRGITMSIGDNVLSFSELQTVLYEIGNLLNERPIGMKPKTNIEEGTYLCPNDLMLGHSSNKVPHGAWNESASYRDRYMFIQQITDSFWRRWQRDFFPTLLTRKKWHVDNRNLRPGDVVLVKDRNARKGEWKIAQVISIFPGRDGRVRDVELRYKNVRAEDYVNRKGVNDMIVNRSVHRLVLLVPIEEQ